MKFTLFIGLLGSLGSALAYLYPPARAGPFGEVMKLGKTSEIPIGEGKFVWFRGQPLWVLHLGEGFVALSALCPHGCLLDWDEKRKLLVDPCHGGAFDADGSPLGGLHSSPLTRFEVVVIGEEIHLRRSG